jgi:hypothetical protein
VNLIKIPHGGRVAEVLARAKAEKIDITGDEHFGTFSYMSVHGAYVVGDENIVLEVTKKPRLMPGLVIEAALKAALAELAIGG